ncbi:hypothetical protein GCM10027167_67570 [Nocardia heshunensis]
MLGDGVEQTVLTVDVVVQALRVDLQHPRDGAHPDRIDTFAIDHLECCLHDPEASELPGSFRRSSAAGWGSGAGHAAILPHALVLIHTVGLTEGEKTHAVDI